MVKILLDCRHLDLQAKNNQGHNAAHIAAIHNQLPVMELLMTKSEERFPHQDFHQDGPQAHDERMMVPLHYAVLKSNYKMVKFLVENKQREIAMGIYKKQRLGNDDSSKVSPDRNGKKKQLQLQLQ